jgi:hypothetical protein
MMKRTFTVLPILVLGLAGCMKDELAVPAQPRGDGQQLEVCLGPGYNDQLWMDLATGSTISVNGKEAWDLAFESAPSGWHVMLNGSRLMTAWNIGPAEITQAMDTAGMAAARRIDAPSGNMDSTAIGDCRSGNDVFVLDLGYGSLGQWFGIRKLRFMEVSADRYVFQVARQDGSELNTVIVHKDPARAFTSFSFSTGVVPVEPVRGSWDLVFTQFTHQFYEPFLPYIVSGVLSAAGTRVSEVDGAVFENVTLADTIIHPFSSARDAIGYDWKEYSFETSSYTVRSNRTYIVQDAQGYYVKLRFLDFYSEVGQVGCPRFETVPL